MNKLIRLTMICMLAFIGFSNITSAQMINAVVSITGTVSDNVTRKPASVDLVITDKTGKRIGKSKSNAVDGYYMITGLKPGVTYKLLISGLDYMNEEIDIVVPNTDKYTEVSKDLLVKPLVAGIRIPLSVAPYEVNQSKVRYGADLFLNDIVALLKYNKTLNFSIVTYPDNDNDVAANSTLTKARCEAIKAYLLSKGVKEERLTVEANDKTDPRNPPPSGKAAKGKRYIGTTYFKITGY